MSSFDFQDFSVSKERGESDIRVYFKVFFTIASVFLVNNLLFL